MHYFLFSKHAADAAFILLMLALVGGSLFVALFERDAPRRSGLIPVFLAIFPLALSLKHPILQGEFVSASMELLASVAVLIVAIIGIRQGKRNDRAGEPPSS